jgi:beta-lactamase class A
MTQLSSRRRFLASTAGAAWALARVSALAQPASDPAGALAALESRTGGRLGVGLLHTGSGRLIGHRLDERFAMCSTFKLPLAAVVLREADQGRLRLDEAVAITKADLVPYAPVVEPKVGQTMTFAALAEAAQTTSDNAAANLLLRRLGGPAAFTAALRGLGDTVTRLDRTEPALNLVKPGEEHDTTSPRAMATLLGRVLAGDALTAASRDRLIGWMVGTTTGGKRLRAGLPPSWRSGDKTGTAQADVMTDKVNDIGITWPPGQAPVVITAYFDSSRRTDATQPADEAALAEVGRIAAAWALA